MQYGAPVMERRATKCREGARNIVSCRADAEPPLAEDQNYFSVNSSSIFLRINSSPLASFQLSSPYHQ